MLVKGLLKEAQFEPFSEAGKPSPSSYPYRVIWNTDLSKAQVSDGTQWITLGSGSTSGINYISNSDFEAGIQGWSIYDDKGSLLTCSSISSNVFTTSGAHSLSVGDAIFFTQIGSLTGISTNTRYYVNSVPSSTTFSIALTRGGSTISIGGTIGTTTCYDIQVVNGTGGSVSATDFEFDRTTSNPLRGIGTGRIQKKTTNLSAGEGISYDFTIALEDRAKMMTGVINYQISSGTFSDDDLEVWIFDVQNSVLIQPTPFLVKKVGSGVVNQIQFQFQTAFGTYPDANFGKYRLIIHNTNPTTTAYTMYIDDISVSPVTKSYGVPMYDLGSLTTTGTWTSNTTYTGKYRREGRFLVGNVNIVLSGAPNSASLYLNLPSGLAIDSTWYSNPASDNVIGQGDIDDAGVIRYYVRAVYNNTVTSGVYPIVVSDNSSGSLRGFSQVTQAVPITIGSSDNIRFHYRVPILGWSDNTLSSSEQTTRGVYALSYIGDGVTTTIGSIASSTDYALILTNNTTYTKDTHGSWSQLNATPQITTTIANGSKYTFAVSGWYSIRYVLQYAGFAAGFRNPKIFKNGVLKKDYNTIISTTTSYTANLEDFDYYNAGDYIQFIVYSSGATGTINIHPVNNPSLIVIEQKNTNQQITASEKVYAEYYNSAGSSIANATTPLFMDYPTKVYDSHNAVVGYGNGINGTYTNTFRFIAPKSDLYCIIGTTALEFPSGVNVLYYMSLYVNGSERSRGGRVELTSTALQNGGYTNLQASTNIYLNQWEALSVFIYQSSGASRSLEANNFSNKFTIVSQGVS